VREIEVKASLSDARRVEQELQKLGAIFSAPVKQIDTVYTKITGNVDEYLKNDHFVRIREKSDGRYIFTVKVPKAVRENLAKIEHETEVKDAKELEQCLFLMGYKLSNKVIKIRRTTKVKDYEINIDNVDELGSFIEIEKMIENERVTDEEILGELKKFLFSLGVPPASEVRKGYDILMLEKIFG